MANSRQFIVVFLLLMLAALLLTGCAGFGGPKQPVRPLYTGSDGVIMSFPSSNALIFNQDERFTLNARLLNDGTSTINSTNPGYVTVVFDNSVLEIVRVASSSTDVTQDPIMSVDRTNAPLTSIAQSAMESIQGSLQPSEQVSQGALEPNSAKVKFTARGRSIDYPVGDVAFVEFTFNARTLASNRARATTPLSLQVCYPYTTTFIAEVCIATSVRSDGRTNACEEASISAQPQGAPVAVRTVTPRYTRLDNDRIEMRYDIELENLRDGLVLWNKEDTSSKTTCDLETLSRTEYGRAEVTAFISRVPLKCGIDEKTGEATLEGIARFDRRKARVTCRLVYEDNQQERANYFAPIIILVRYFYIQTQTSQLEVIR